MSMEEKTLPLLYPKDKPFIAQILPQLESLRKATSLIIQPILDGTADFLNPTQSHEIYNEKRHLLFKGNSNRKSIFSRKSRSRSGGAPPKIQIVDLKGTKAFSVQFQNDKLCNLDKEAIISCPLGSELARISKFEEEKMPLSSISNPSQVAIFYQISSPINNQILFQVQQTLSSPDSKSSEFIILGGEGNQVGGITSKTGLTFILHLKSGDLNPTEKAILTGFIIAMDGLKDGKKTRKLNHYD